MTRPTKHWTTLGTNLCLVLGMLDLGLAGALGWSLPAGQSQVLSDGSTPIPANAVFQLGVFAGSFVPDTGNQADWAVNWRSADFAHYNAEFSAISGYYNVEVNSPPFTSGKPMYVWGVYLKADGSSEQWLGTATPWQVPSDDPLVLPEQIDIDDATTLLLGSANSSAGTIQMEAAATGGLLPVIYGDPWRQHYFALAEIANPSIGEWQADPDSDGLNNALEFAMGFDPLNPQPFGSMKIQAQAGSFLLSCPGWPTAAVSIGMEESTDLQISGSPLSPPPGFNPGTSRWELLVPMSSQKNFFRTTVEIPDMP